MARRATTQKAVLYSLCFGRPLASPSDSIRRTPPTESTPRRPLFKSPLSQADTQYLASVINRLHLAKDKSFQSVQENTLEVLAQAFHENTLATEKAGQAIRNAVSRTADRIEALEASVVAVTAKHQAVLAENLQLRTRLSQCERILAKQSGKKSLLKTTVETVLAS